MTAMAEIELPPTRDPRRRNDYWWVAVLFALLLQTATIAYYGGRTVQQVESQAAILADHEQRLRDVEAARFRQLQSQP